MATITAIKGETFAITGTVYSTGTTPADITGAVITCMVKTKSTDVDGSAILTISGSVVSGPAGTYTIPFAASDTNTKNVFNYFLEVVVKVGTTYYRNGENTFKLVQNVVKTLP